MPKQRLTVLLAPFFVFALANTAKASEIFNINLVIGSASVTGTITTDGVIGQLALSDITALDLILTAPPRSQVATDVADNYRFNGADLFETDSELIFNFSGTDQGGVTFLSDAQGVAWSVGTAGFLQNCCSIDIATAGLETDHRGFPVNYTELTGNVVIGQVASTPEPAPFTLTLVGLGSLVFWRKLIVPAM